MAQLIKDTLDAHNHQREIHQAKPLTWDEDCFSTAQQWAEVVSQKAGRPGPDGEPRGLFHGGLRKGMGQNVWWTAEDASVEDAVAGWMREARKYDPEVENPSETGNFTQVVWKKTRKVGLGIVRVPRPDGVPPYDPERPPDYSYGTFLVANYYPHGNTKGKFKENVYIPSLPPKETNVAPSGQEKEGDSDPLKPAPVGVNDEKIKENPSPPKEVVQTPPPPPKEVLSTPPPPPKEVVHTPLPPPKQVLYTPSPPPKETNATQGDRDQLKSALVGVNDKTIDEYFRKSQPRNDVAAMGNKYGDMDGVNGALLGLSRQQQQPNQNLRTATKDSRDEVHRLLHIINTDNNSYSFNNQQQQQQQRQQQHRQMAWENLLFTMDNSGLGQQQTPSSALGHIMIPGTFFPLSPPPPNANTRVHHHTMSFTEQLDFLKARNHYGSNGAGGGGGSHNHNHYHNPNNPNPLLIGAPPHSRSSSR